MRIVPLLALSAVLAVVSLGGAHPTISVGPNVQVSVQRSRISHDEVMIAADPNNASRLLVCGMATPPERWQPFDLVYSSIDGGRSWRAVVDLLDRSSTDLDRPWTVDVDCTFGADGRAYFVASAVRPPEGGPGQAWIYRSTDGGQGWGPRTLVPNVFDRPYLAVDRTAGPNRGRIYLSHATRFLSLDTDVSLEHNKTPAGGVALRVSTDGGDTFPITAQHFVVPGSDKLEAHPTSQNLLLSDGTLLLFVQHRRDWKIADEHLDASLKLMKSTDGGRSLAPAKLVAELDLAHPFVGMSWLPSAAVDSGSRSFRDRVYVVWADRRSGRVEIWFTSSTDKGETWTTPRVLNDDVSTLDGKGRNHGQPAVAVNKDGIVGVSWYDRRDSADNVGYHVRFRASLDGGETWLPSVRVSEAASRFEQGEDWVFESGGEPGATLAIARRFRTYWGGHHAGMTADADGVFHPVWTDNRTGLQQVWTAPVQVSGSVAAHGGGTLAPLIDVSSKVAVQMVTTRYNRDTSVLEVSVRLCNKSPRTISGPVYLRALVLSSELGSLSAINADNRVTGAGAVWGFENTLTGGLLLPNGLSGQRTLLFALTEPRPPRAGRTFRIGVMTLNALVLAGGER